ncbi:MAG: hypothetical protein AMXMBFR64_12820 [Myxococcales bacterium]
MRRALALVLLLACDDAGDRAPEAGAADVPGDGGSGSVDAGDAGCPTCPTFDVTVDTTDVLPDAPPVLVSVELPHELVPGRPATAVLRVPAGELGPVTATVDVVVGGTTRKATIYRGVGSLPVVAPSEGELTIAVAGDGLAGERAVPTVARPARTLTGVLSGGDLAWGPEQDVRITGEVVVPAGETLTIEAGARVLLEPQARLKVDGKLVAEGTEDAPVLLTSASEPWGELDVPGDATLAHTWLIDGGGDGSRAVGHSKSQPVVRVVGGSLTMTGGGIADSPGKALWSDGAKVHLDGVLITRCDTGGEHKASEVILLRSHVLEIPDGDGVVADDDNDGIYLGGGDTGGPQSHIGDTTFAVGEDDAIDHNGAKVRIERVWIEGFFHEGIATSTGGRVEVIDTVVKGCAQGIECGYGAPDVSVVGCLVTGNGVGLRWGDDYDWEAKGTFHVERTVAVGNTTNVRFEDDQQGAPPVGATSITCSMVDTPAWDGVGNNGAGIPGGGPGGCVHQGSVTVGPTCGVVGPGACK